MFPQINNLKNPHKIQKKSNKKIKTSHSEVCASQFNANKQCRIHPGCIWSMDCMCKNCKKINLLYDAAN